MNIVGLVAFFALIPAPPVVNYQRGLPEGMAADEITPAAYDPNTKTVHFAETLSKVARGHELGHAFDHQVLTEGDRTYFIRLMGLECPWDQGTGYTPVALAGKSPIETFADWYGNAINKHDAVHSWDASYTSPPDAKTFRRFKQALVRLGRRHSLPLYR